VKKVLRRYWLLMVGLVLFAAAVTLSVALPSYIGQWDNTVKAITVSTGWVLFLLQYFYSKSERLYVWTNSLRLWLANGSTKWNFTVELRACAKERPLCSVWTVIKQQGQQASPWHHDDSSLIVNMPGYTLRAFVSAGPSPFDGDPGYPRDVCIQISNLELPFRTFRAKIENEAMPLIRDIVDILQPATEKYAAKIGFSANNPYFGLFVRTLDLPKVVSFTCDLIESSIGGHDQIVTVRKDQIEIVSSDLLALQALSLKYVRLASK